MDYASLQDALNQLNITQRLAPMYLPEGYTLNDLQISRSPKENSVYARYRNNNEHIQVSIRQLMDGKPEDIEKSESYILAYDANGITYYIFENNNNLQATWVVGEFEGLIIGDVTIEEMKAIIDSI